MRYDYQCEKCGHVQEVEHGMTEKPKIDCPKCKSTKVYKKLGGHQINMGDHPGTSLSELD